MDRADEQQLACALVSPVPAFGRQSLARAFAVTELALILGIQGAALAYALVVGRAVVVPDAPSLRLRRLGAALDRATSSFFAKLLRVVLLSALLLGGALFLLHLFRSTDVTRLTPVQRAIGAWLGLLLGAGLGLATAYGALRLGVRGTLQVATAATAGLDRALGVATRSGGAAGVLAETASFLGLMLLFGGAFALAGGTVLSAPDALSLARELLPLLAAFPVGAAIAALVVQRAGGTFQGAVNLAGCSSSPRDAELELGDPRHPALVGDLAGRHLGESAGRAALTFLGNSAAHVAVLALGLAALRADATPLLSLVFLPFVVRAFFLLASLFAFSVVRIEEMQSPSVALVRGRASATAIGVAGLLGACVWLGREHASALFAAGLAGVFAALLVGAPIGVRLLRRERAFRESSESVRAGSDAAVLSSLGAGFEVVLVPTLVVGIAAAGAWALGARTGLFSGGIWGTLVAWAALLGSLPFAYAVSSASTLAETARGAAAVAALDGEAQRRTARLDESLPAAASARAELTTCATATSLLAVLALPAIAGSSLTLEVLLLDPAVTWSGALGLALVLAYAASAARLAAFGARDVTAEVERQLRRFQRERGVVKLPPEFAPSYKACVDLPARSALRKLVPHVFGTLLLLPLLALALQLPAQASERTLALRGLTSFVLFATLAGFVATFSIDAARATLALWRRLGRATFGTESRALIHTAAGTADLLGGSASPAAQALFVAAAALGLALAPFIT